MVNRKVTPEIEKFIQSNCALSPGTLSGLIEKKFKLRITGKALEPHVNRARAEAAASNNAKVEAVRAKILRDGDLRAEKYLKYMDENVEALHKLIVETDNIAVENARDFVAVSQALQKSLGVILDFVKPPEKIDLNVNLKPDFSKLSDDELDNLERIATKLAGSDGNPQAES